MRRGEIVIALVASGLMAAGTSRSGGEERAKRQVTASEGPHVVAVVAGAPITAVQLDEVIGNKLAKVKAEEYNIKRMLLEDLIGRTLIDREAVSRKMPSEELLQVEVEKKARLVTEEETRAVYESAKDRFPGASEAEALKSIGSSMRQQRISQRRSEFVNELKAKAGARILLDPPRVAVDPSDDPFKGPKDAPVTVVEFSDFQCPYCSRVVETLKRVEERYRGKLRIVYRDFPLPMHKEAAKAAEAAECANEQGKFWEMHDKLYSSQTNLQVGDLKRYATEIGINSEQFNRCLDSGKYTAEWQRDKADGSSFGVSGTPTFFVNGRILGGLQSYESFVQVIDDELERAGIAPPVAAASGSAVAQTLSPPTSAAPAKRQQK